MYLSMDNVGENSSTGRNTPASKGNAASRRNSVVFKEEFPTKGDYKTDSSRLANTKDPMQSKPLYGDQRDRQGQRKGSASQRDKDGGNVGTKMFKTRQKQQPSLDGTKSPVWSENFRPSTAQENTYKLEPDELFNVEKTEKIIQEVLFSFLQDMDGENNGSTCSLIANVIKDKIKQSGVNRYKLVAYVIILEENNTSIQYVSRCLWDTNFDNYATATYRADNFSAIGSVYASYYD